VIRKEVGESGLDPLLRKNMSLSSKYTASQLLRMLRNKYTNRFCDATTAQIR